MAFASTSRNTLVSLRHISRAVGGQSQARQAVAGSSRWSSGAPPAPVDPPVNATSPIPPPTHSAPIPTPTSPSIRSEVLDFPPLRPAPRSSGSGTHVATLRLASYHPAPLGLFTSFALHSAASLGIPTSGAASLPTVTSLYTVPKSPFVHKKSQENFQRKEHKRAIKVFDANRDSVDLWLRYLKQHAVGGVGLRAEVFEWVQPGQVGREMQALQAELQGEGAGARAGSGAGSAAAPEKAEAPTPSASAAASATATAASGAEAVKNAAGNVKDTVKGVAEQVKEKAEELVKEFSKKGE